MSLVSKNTAQEQKQEQEHQAHRQQELIDVSSSFAFTTCIDKIIAWGRKNSLWPLPYGTACCGIEMMSVLGPRYDLARFGAEVVRFSPRQADLLLVAGTITEKMAPILLTLTLSTTKKSSERIYSCFRPKILKKPL